VKVKIFAKKAQDDKKRKVQDDKIVALSDT
jgi:hypothetical protein